MPSLWALRFKLNQSAQSICVLLISFFTDYHWKKKQQPKFYPNSTKICHRNVMNVSMTFCTASILSYRGIGTF